MASDAAAATLAVGNPLPSHVNCANQIRLVTTPQSSPDTVRLWLERSGSTVPLDIEIFLHTHSHHAVRDTPSMHRRAPTVTLSAASAWEAPWWENDLPGTPPAAADAAANGPAATYIHIPANGPPHFIPIAAVPNSPPLQHHHVHAGPAPIYHEVVPISSWRQLSHTSRSSGVQHWGYIAFYYLMQQMHRWERFVFRFDRQFPSINALKSMVGEHHFLFISGISGLIVSRLGDAPLLREFEVSGAEPALLNDWSWLPCAKTIHNNLEHLSSLTLQYVPFKWSSPIFQNLQTLNLRTLPANTLALDRILYILSMNTQLVNLSLHITSANPAVLPLTPTTLEHVKSFAIGGHFLLAGLVDVLTLPAVDTLSIDIEARDPIEETLTNLLIRSSHPPVARLSISYGLHTAAAGIYYHAGSAVTAWNFLGEMDALRTLQVGGAPFEPLVAILGTPEDDGQDQWYCPNLVALSMKACRPSHSDGVAKLVQMVEARNPDPASGAVPVSAGGITPVKLRHLELYDCTPLGLDVIRWLNGRITDVVCTEPSFDT